MVYGPYKRTMATDCRILSETQSPTWKARAAATGFTLCPQRHLMDSTNGRPVGRLTGAISAEKYLPSTLPGVDRIGGFYQDPDSIGPGLKRAWRHRPERGVYRRNVGVDLITPHKGNRRMPVTQDGRSLRRFRKRWKVERLFAWLQNYRRLVVRYEYHLKNFLAMIQLGCIVILIRRVLG